MVNSSSEAGSDRTDTGGLADELLDYPPGDRRREQRIAGGDGANALHKLRPGHVLQEKPTRSGLHRLVDVLVEIKSRQDENVGFGKLRQQLTSRFEPVASRHPDVHQHDLRTQAASLGDDLEAVGGLAHDLDVLLRVENHAEAVTHERLIVGDEDPNHTSSRNGNRARTV